MNEFRDVPYAQDDVTAGEFSGGGGMKLVDLYRSGDVWHFTWKPSECDAFDEEREHMKEVLREYGLCWTGNENKEWTVQHAEDISSAFALVFDNADWLFDQIGRQIELFTRG